MPDMTRIIAAAQDQLDYVETRLHNLQPSEHRNKLEAEAIELKAGIEWLTTMQELV